MSYQVLARKWRPKTFREMVGQEHVLKALINALDHNRLHHAYLFTGTRGVGKTTIARILAKCLNCEAGVSSEPCGQCSACVSINDGRFVDLIEVDAASRTKVEDTRELLENVQYAPTVGRYKVYLIDEVHMLSTHSFNALLKTLEEPPPHVKFLLATTDPQKLPATVLSRCLQFNLKNMSPERIVDHLKYVLEQEMVGFDEAALWLLGRSADGSMRDAMSLADQGVSFGSGKLLEPDVRNMLGTIDQTAVYDIIEALAAADGAQVLAAVDQLSEHAPDYVAALEELLTLLHRIAITQAVPEATDNSFGDKERVTDLAGRLAAENVQLFYQMGLNGRRDLPLAPDPRSGFEMVLLRMLAFMPAGIAQLPQGSVQNSAPVANNTAASAEAPEPVKKPEPVPQPSAVAEEPESKLPPAATPISLDQLNPTNWNQLFDRLGFGGVVGNIASHCVLQQIEGDTITLGLDENNATLFSDSYTARIQQHLSVTLNAPIKLKINVTPVQVETPSGRKQRLIKERRQQAFVDLQNDPNVQTLINDFSAVLVEESVEPVLHGARKQ
ncbi:MAG: DNA polymerase III subunit gamma/tau [Oceanicoccus sp.]|uniref:DNA polymerase III subunit gamma/tau n=1 Tax=Oceanicoccus sp. TaxID=2691044 RepID=UPI002611B801|nr:DNA polymerase III subunit gamma/tau [Oceanicoccus sp.]MCP3907588.1 DNA polymerase III subunit gamma/tau [Oceanicoccus sp.]MDG1773673.1 DNA polymerase III subunit gamma/tau [Oceanicoccus sp.]